MVIPAIDLLSGEVVRLYKGDYRSKTVYSSDPAKLAGEFREMGAKLLHVVDLDGAKNSSPRNREAIKRISEVLPVQVGGGIRDEETIDSYLEIAERVILGTAAVKNPAFARDMILKKGAERIVVGVDVKNGKVATSGWLEDSGADYLEFIEQLKEFGTRYIIVTDIERDGALSSPNWDMYDRIAGINVIVSGGVSCDADILRAGKYCGVIVGKAYYEGKVDLKKWLKG